MKLAYKGYGFTKKIVVHCKGAILKAPNFCIIHTVRSFNPVPPPMATEVKSIMSLNLITSGPENPDDDDDDSDEESGDHQQQQRPQQLNRKPLSEQQVCYLLAPNNGFLLVC